jgi:hypothetical protein
MLIVRISLALLWLVAPGAPAAGQEPPPPRQPESASQIYLPLVFRNDNSPEQVNAPLMSEMRYATSAVFWFGRVTSAENYADVRVGYTAQRMWVHLEIFDRRLWYDPSPTPPEFAQWDAASLYLDSSAAPGSALTSNSYRLDGMLNWWEPMDDFKVAYRGSAGGWTIIPFEMTVTSGWRGNVPNDAVDDRGWVLVFEIPFASLGLGGAPPQGTQWRMALTLHDRDSNQSAPLADKHWPTTFNPTQPNTWGVLRFGLPTYQPPPGVSPAGQTVIRHGLNGQVVPDAMVGGGFECGQGLDYWTTWGQANYAGSTQVNVQNEFDVSDWPCFSKYYVTFPLSSVPPGKVILSATLTLYLIGNAGGGSWGPPGESNIQVLTIRTPWQESTLNWNNAPLARQNVSIARVDPTTVAGVPREWDVSYAVAQAYRQGGDLSLALYSADGDYNTGRYFNSSDLNIYEQTLRPTLTIVWGNP